MKSGRQTETSSVHTLADEVGAQPVDLVRRVAKSQISEHVVVVAMLQCIFEDDFFGREFDEEGDDVAQLGICFVIIVRQNGDALVHVVCEANDLVVQHQHVFTGEVFVEHDAEVFDEIVIVLCAVLTGQNIQNVF